MSATSDHLADPELLATEWDLSPLEAGGVPEQLEDALIRARELATAYAGRLGELDATGLASAMRELEAIHELVGKAGSFASLQFSTDTADPARGALLSQVQERATEIETRLLFFELEWAALEEDHAERLLAADELDF